MPTEAADRVRIVEAIASGIRRALGEAHSAKRGLPMQVAMAEICRELIAGDPRFADAIRVAVDARLAQIFPSQDVRDLAISEAPPDMLRAYYLLLTPEWILRGGAALKMGRSGEDRPIPGGIAVIGILRPGPGPNDDADDGREG